MDTELQKTSKVVDIWQKHMNPLRNLNSQDIEWMLSQSARGNDVKLQMCYDLIERSAPIFTVCIKKRLAGLAARKWDVVADSDSPEAAAQAKQIKEILQEADTRVVDGLSEAIEWLAMSAFRGRSAVKPFMHDGRLTLKKIMPWHLLFAGNKLWWNPDADEAILWDSTWNKPLKEVPFNEVCLALDSHPVDWPGITVYLRQLVGETKWSQFIERQGIPQIVLEAPDGTPDTSLDEWTTRAWQILQGGSGILPAGGKLTELTSARGQDPFSNFCSHQSEVISILATGGTLLTIGGSTGLGSDLAEQQRQQFDSLITSDCKKVTNAFNSCLIPAIARSLGQKQQCKFAYVEDEDINVSDYISYAKELQAMGVPIDMKKFKELTKLQFIAIDDGSDDASVWTPKSEVEQ